MSKEKERKFIRNFSNLPVEKMLEQAEEYRNKYGIDAYINSSKQNVCQLPAFTRDNLNKSSVKLLYETLGFKVIGLNKIHPIYFNVEMPENWELKKTSDLRLCIYDTQNRKRIKIRYYNLLNHVECYVEKVFRYYKPILIDDDAHYEKTEDFFKHPVQCQVKDIYGNVMFETEPFYYNFFDEKIDIVIDRYNIGVKHKNECENWLNENYPEWCNPFAYWN